MSELDKIIAEVEAQENGLAKVRMGDFKTGTEMYIDKTGKTLWKQK